jgi:hypothetical protein
MASTNGAETDGSRVVLTPDLRQLFAGSVPCEAAAKKKPITRERDIRV